MVDSFGIVDVEEGWTGIGRHVTKSRDRSRSLSFSPSKSFYRSRLTVIQGSRNSWAAGVSCRINRDRKSVVSGLYSAKVTRELAGNIERNFQKTKMILWGALRKYCPKISRNVLPKPEERVRIAPKPVSKA